MTIAKAESIKCGECGAPMMLRAGRHGAFYGCRRFPACKGTHGAHPDGTPLGIPADRETKDARIAAHAAFDPLWQGAAARMTRAEAYLALQSALGMSSADCHIGRFTVAQCEAAVQACEKIRARTGSGTEAFDILAALLTKEAQSTLHDPDHDPNEGAP